jgi:hypothetical protein
MAAKLEWTNGGELMLGAFVLARLSPRRYSVMTGHESERYDDPEDMVQDCESEVRRLLREAGVEVEP